MSGLPELMKQFQIVWLLVFIYLKSVTAQDARCTVIENFPAKSVNITCFVERNDTIVSQARACSFTWSKDGGTSVDITNPVVYSNTTTGESPVSYRFQCAVAVPVQQLGEGTHTFQVSFSEGNTSHVIRVAADRNITLSYPEAFHTCSSAPVHGYFLGDSVRCMCDLRSVGHPRGTTHWARAGLRLRTPGALLVTYDKNYPRKIYSCEAESQLGWRFGSYLTARFAFLKADSVKIEVSPTVIDNCGNTSQIKVTCRVSRDKVSPAPTFSASVGEISIGQAQPGTKSDDGDFYEREFSLAVDGVIGGRHQVSCGVTNTVTNSSEEKSFELLVREPPRSPPTITVLDQAYQSNTTSNIISLAEGFTGNFTCYVEGGFPEAHATQLRCGQLASTGDRNTASLRFEANPLTSKMDGTVCTCDSQHESGCYLDAVTTLRLKVLVVPTDAATDKAGGIGVENWVFFVIAVGIILILVIIVLTLIFRRRCYTKRQDLQQKANEDQGQQNNPIMLNPSANARSPQSPENTLTLTFLNSSTRTPETNAYLSDELTATGRVNVYDVPNPAIINDIPASARSRTNDPQASGQSSLYDTPRPTGQHPHQNSSAYSNLTPCAPPDRDQVYHTISDMHLEPMQQVEEVSQSSHPQVLVVSEPESRGIPDIYSHLDHRNSVSAIYCDIPSPRKKPQEETGETTSMASSAPSSPSAFSVSSGCYAHPSDVLRNSLEIYHNVSEPLRF